MITRLGNAIRFHRNRGDLFRGRIDFVIGGVQKAGTTALAEMLRDVPGIGLSIDKEPHFFTRLRGCPSWPALAYLNYHTRFYRSRPGERRLGEATPLLTYWHDGPRRLWEYNPALRWIVVLRDPIERAYSHWNMECRRGNESLDFGTAIRSEAARCRAALPWQHHVYSYVDRGFYSEQLRRLYRFFPRDQVLVLRSEDVRDRPGHCIDRILRLLGLPAAGVEWPAAGRRAHVGRYAEPMAARDRAFLRSIYETELRTLERLLDWDCGDWLAAAGESPDLSLPRSAGP